MSVQMVKIGGKMVPARKNKEGKWEAIENSELVMNKDGQLEIAKSHATQKEKEA